MSASAPRSKVRKAGVVAPSLSLTSSSIDSSYFGSVGIQVDGLESGESVILDRFQVNTTDGTVDGAAILQQRVTLTDGEQGLIGGVANVNVIADLTPADGSITAQVDFFTSFVPQMIGEYVFRVSSPSGRFTPLSTRFTVTPAPLGQAVKGRVTSGGSGLAHAYVCLLDEDNAGLNFVAGAVADATGHYTIPARPGNYRIVAARPGYGIRLATETAVTLAAGTDATVDTTVLAGTRHIRGRLADKQDPSKALAGVQVVLVGNFGENEASEISFVYTGLDGTFDALVSAGRWSVYVLDDAVTQIGYVGLLDGVEVDVVDGDESGIHLLLPKATALYNGHVTGTGGAPLEGVEVLGFTSDFSYGAFGTSDADGYYTVAISTDHWRVEPFADSLEGLGYVGVRSIDTGPLTDTAVVADFSAEAASATLDVQVNDAEGNPIPYLAYRIYQDGGTSLLLAATDEDGRFTVGLHAGSFLLEAAPETLSGYIEARPANVTLAAADTQSITLQLLSPSNHVNVHVVDQFGSPVPFFPLYLGATLAGKTHRAAEYTDWDGNASLPAIPGDWTLLLNESGYFAPESYGFLPTTNRPVTVAGADVAYELVLTSTLVTRDESLRVVRGTPVTLSLAKLLANDSVLPGHSPTLVYIETTGTGGGGIVRSGGSVTYTPPASGSADTFSYIVTDGDGNYAAGTVGVVITEPGAGTFNILGIVPDGTDMVVRFAGVPGVTYQIQHSSNPAGPVWHNDAAPVADAAGRFEFRDISPGAGTRFYRALRAAP